ncbi:MAG TPA: hypothetical protein PKZ69_02715 [Candidatus Cloacimonadota bacterium]|nr:hypothetical protein [Candidatus Cloacimonadota bacterium]HOQ81295.1 hypothetical protein [Candidatus Cloacimonadota bacterium]HPK40509.1 hypothetical protein [Candidatus Cloacimonadota bacterium]
MKNYFHLNQQMTTTSWFRDDFFRSNDFLYSAKLLPTRFSSGTNK